MDLFDHHAQQVARRSAPLADRMRPRTLDEFIGQDHLIAPGRLLRRAIEADQLSSLIFSGPPGTGKTTLAQIIANRTRAQFLSLNAVLAGIKEIRAAIDQAQESFRLYQQRTILFVDEVHRFNKSQQDALLPWVEKGTVLLIGATTENPYFEVNKALVSRSRLFQLKSLTDSDLKQVIEQALVDPERGYGDRRVVLDPNARDHLITVANGDARSLLNALELAIETTPPDPQGQIQITLAVAEESIQQRAVLYDREGDAHFDTISAFIKSVRGSDPDAALYWLARMIYAGEDPRFILRRLLILASEDIGLADPQAVVIFNVCAAAFVRIVLPEGNYPLAQATLYLATAAKSNSVMGFFDALKAVEDQQAEVPNPLKDNKRDQQGFGHGAGYRYPHAYRDHWVAQQYLPDTLQGQVFYQPSNQGYEDQIQRRVTQRREEQLAALQQDHTWDLPEILTVSPTDKTQDRWLQRAIQKTGSHLGSLRDQLFSQAQIRRHDRVLVLNAGDGVLIWEAIRATPEGGVWGWIKSEKDWLFLQDQAQGLSDLSQPHLVQGSLRSCLDDLDPDLRFDQILGINTLYPSPDRAAIVRSLRDRLSDAGRLILAEPIPKLGQRLYDLFDPNLVDAGLRQNWIKAEESIYKQTKDPFSHWDESEIQTLFPTPQWSIQLQRYTLTTEILITSILIQRWFTPQPDRLSYQQHLEKHLTSTQIHQVKALFDRHLHDQRVQWQRIFVLITAS